MTDANTYAAAGVDVAKAEKFVERLKNNASRATHKQLWKAAGGYASVVPINDDLAVALTTDGVGTKLLIAVELSKLDGIGIDLVAMCANDLICVGAIPTAFLDYYATPKLDDEQADSIISGIIKGCDLAGVPLVGGETAELPGLYADKHFDLAGFAVGTVTKAALLTGERIQAGDIVIGVASTGIHSNGFSLVRKLIPSGHPLREQVLTPTAIYVKAAVELLQQPGAPVKAMAHITGGGWRNLFRLNKKVGYEIDTPLPLPAIFDELKRSVAPDEMYKTFNMGMGLAVIAAPSTAQQCIDLFGKHGFEARAVGRVTAEAETMVIDAHAHFGRSAVVKLSG